MINQPRRARGNSKSAYAYNQNLAAARSIAPNSSGGGGVLITQTPNGTFYRVRRQRVVSGGASATIKRFEIVSVLAATLTCKEVLVDSDGNESLADDTTTVNRPPDLVAPSETLPNSRTTATSLSGISVAIIEGLEPPYVTGSRIIAAKISDVYRDVNDAGRHWDIPYTVVKVCLLVGTQTVTRNMVIRGGAPFV